MTSVPDIDYRKRRVCRSTKRRTVNAHTHNGYRTMIVRGSVCFPMDTSPVAVGGSPIAPRYRPRATLILPRFDPLSSIAVVQTASRRR